MTFYTYLLWCGVLISPLNADLSFSGTYCNISTCGGSGLVYCDSGCCHDFGTTRCCPNSMMIVLGSIFGFLLGCVVVAACIVIYHHRRHRKLHSESKYMCSETQTSQIPPVPEETRPGEPPRPIREPGPPPYKYLESILNN